MRVSGTVALLLTLVHSAGAAGTVGLSLIHAPNPTRAYGARHITVADIDTAAYASTAAMMRALATCPLAWRMHLPPSPSPSSTPPRRGSADGAKLAVWDLSSRLGWDADTEVIAIVSATLDKYAACVARLPGVSNVKGPVSSNTQWHVALYGTRAGVHADVASAQRDLAYYTGDPSVLWTPATVQRTTPKPPPPQRQGLPGADYVWTPVTAGAGLTSPVADEDDGAAVNAAAAVDFGDVDDGSGSSSADGGEGVAGGGGGSALGRKGLTAASPPGGLAPSPGGGSGGSGGGSGGQCGECRPNSNKYCLNDLSKACDQASNFKCGPCTLFEKDVYKCGQKGTCPGGFYNTSSHQAAGRAPHWLIMPAQAISGVEGIFRDAATAAATDALWSRAWGDALSGANRRPVVAAASLALVANPMVTRTQHQLHIHVSEWSAGFAGCVASMNLPTKYAWSSAQACTLPCGAITLWGMRVNGAGSISTHMASARGQAAFGGADFGLEVGAAVTPNPKGSGNVLVLFKVPASCANDHTLLRYDP